MIETTPRDRAWVAIVDALLEHESIRIKDVREETGISHETAQEALHAAKSVGLFERETDHSHWFKPAVGFGIDDIDDWEYERAIRTLVEEAKQQG